MENYSIVDITGYATTLRRYAADSLAENNMDNLDDYITINQVIGVIKEYASGLDDNDHYIINEDISENIYLDIVEWIYDVGVAKLAAENKIECAWDDDLNKMIFWIPKNDKSSKRTNKKRNTKYTRKNRSSE